MDMQILIVEDEEKIANFLRRGLLEERYAVDIALDGEDALYKFEINAYDLVILDLMIPKLDGISVCRKIREVDTSIPVLMLTARDATEDKIKGLDAGADDYMTKPFSIPLCPFFLSERSVSVSISGWIIPSEKVI